MSVDIEREAKISRLAVAAVEIAQRGAAGLYGATECVADGLSQPTALDTGNFSGTTRRPDSGGEQGFVGVNVADPRKQPTVKQGIVNGTPATA